MASHRSSSRSTPSPRRAPAWPASVGREWVIQGGCGKVIERESKNPKMATGDIETGAASPKRWSSCTKAELPPLHHRGETRTAATRDLRA